VIGKNCKKCPKSLPCDTETEWVDGYITICPVQFYPEVQVAFTASHRLEKGVMPNAGGWADQPAKLMYFTQIVDTEKAKHHG